MADVFTDSGRTLLATYLNSGTAGAVPTHIDIGTGTTTAAVGQTALVTPSGLARQAVTKSNPTSNVLRAVTTTPFTATGALAVTEAGLFSAVSAGTMFTRHDFLPVNLATGDSLTVTINVTLA